MAKCLPLIHTIGHSDHSTVEFVDLLRRHRITLVVDVRSQPYSRWAPQFNRDTLARDLQEAGIAYRFMGDALGGRPSDYQRIEQTPAYQAAIDRLLGLTQTARVAVMCSEGDHRHCHRHLLITQTLLARGARVLHIQPDGRTVEGAWIPQQLSLFG